MPTHRVDSDRRKQIVADACKRPLPSVTLAKQLYAKHPRLFSTLNAATTAVRYHLGKRGKTSRDNAKARDTLRPHGSPHDRPPLPKSIAEPWEPFVLNARRVLVLSDTHVPFHDEAAIETALAYGETFGPDAILWNGDVLDYEAISKFDRLGPGPTVGQELACAKELFAHVHHRFPGVPQFYKLGNHDERWELYLWRKAMELAELCKDVWQHFVGIDEFGITIIRDGRPVMCGKLPILHGHELSKGFVAPVNPARGAFLKMLSSCLIAHHHRQSEHDEPTFWGEVISCRSQACLCFRHQRYARINKWQHGFATVEVHDDGGYELELKKIIGGKVR
jgi:hypothetical protein